MNYKKTESAFQKIVIEEIEKVFKGCIILKNDPTYIQGIPDLLILYKKYWFALECKRNTYSHMQPNQMYYLNKMKRMSSAFIITPENKEDIFYELQQTFR